MSALGYDAWLASPYTDTAIPGDVEDAYALYLEAHRAQSDRDFAAGGHDYIDPDKFYADGDTPESFEDFYDRWCDDQEQAAIERAHEARYPDARL